MTYAPIAPEVATGTLTFTAAAASASVSLNGAAIVQALSIAPAAINYGFVPPLSTLVECTSVTNQLSSVVHITGVTDLSDGDGAFTVSATDDASPPNPISYPIAIPGGQSAKVCFGFAPAISQVFTGQATLANDSQGGNPVVQLTGEGGGPQIACTPSPLDFGNLILGSSSTLPVKCTNTGTPIASTNLTLGQPRVSPSAFSAQFDPAHPYSSAGIVAGQSIDIDVTFTPGASGTASGTLVVPNNGGQGVAFQVPLTATVFASACEFVILPPALDFGNPPVGSSPITLGFEVQNTGSGPCLVSSPAIPIMDGTAYRVTSVSLAPDPQTQLITLAPPGGDGASNLDVEVTFQPGSTGLYPGQAAFSILNASPSAQSVSLSGSSESSCLVVAPQALDFGTLVFANGQSCGGADGLSFTIFNQCVSQQDTLSAVTLQSGLGDATQQFGSPQGTPPPIALAPGGQAGVNEISYLVSFLPTSAGAHTGQIVISDGVLSTLVELSGTALEASTQTDNFVAAPSKVDVLFLIDTTADDGAVLAPFLSGGATALLQAGSQVDYRIAVTTDDNGRSLSAELGRLLPCSTCSVKGTSPEIITPATVPDGGTSADPGAALAALVGSIPLSLSNQPEFFQSLLLAIERAPASQVDFLRPGAALAVITVANTKQGDDSGLVFSWYQDYFQNVRAPLTLTWSYLSENGTSDGFGDLPKSAQPSSVQQMLAATRGIAANASDPAWVDALAAEIWPPVSSTWRYPLSVTPIGGQSAIAVSLNGVSVAQSGSGGPNWTYDLVSNAVTFTSNQPPANGDQIAITYPIGCQ